MTRSGLRVLVVDDHPIVRRCLKEVLADAGDVVDVGEAGHSGQALDLARSQPWDVVLLDLGLPGRSGIELLKELHAEWPKLPVLILSMQPEGQYAVRTLQAGAAGYLTKPAAPEKLLDAIRTVTSGGRYISEAVAEQLAAQLTVDAIRPIHESLSDREHEVLRLIGSGKTIGDIAEQLSLSVTTVSSYRARILDKMGMSNNAELIQYAIRNGLVD